MDGAANEFPLLQRMWHAGSGDVVGPSTALGTGSTSRVLAIALGPNLVCD
jgi:hypothetical protein